MKKIIPANYEFERFEAIFNSMSEGMVSTDNEGKCSFINKTALNMLGYRKKQCIGKYLQQLLYNSAGDKKTSPASVIPLSRSLQGKKCVRAREIFYRADRTPISVRLVSNPIIKNGEVKGAVIIFNDITIEVGEPPNEEQILISEQRFRNLVQNGSDMIAILDASGIYQYVSPTSMTVLNIAPEYFIGKNAFDFIHPDDVPMVMGQFQRLQNEKQLAIPEFRFLDSAGNWRWLETIVSNMNDDPAVRGIVANSRDITQRKQAELDVKKSEEKYKMLFQYTPLPKWIYDVETLEILDVNVTAVEKYGYSREEFLQMTIKDLRPAAEVSGMMKRYEEALAKDQAIHRFGVYIHQKKDGGLLKAEIWGHRLEYDDRDCMLVLVDDVTEREHVLNLLKENEEKLRVATSIGKLGYWQLDLLQDKLTWSDEVFQIWGILPGKINPDMGYFLKTMPSSDREPFLSAQAATLRGERELDCEHRVILADGSIKWVHERGRIVKEADGRPVTFGGTVQDITNKKVLELTLQERNQRYKLVTQATSDVIWDWNISQNSLYLAESFKKIFGHATSRQPNIDDKHRHIHPDDIEKVKTSLQKAIQQKADRWESEYRLKRSNGEYAYVIDKGFLIKDNQDNPIRIVGALRDISQQKAEVHQLKLLGSVITQTSDSVLITESVAMDRSGPAIIYANAAFTQMTGYSQDELRGKPPGILHGVDTDESELARLYQSILDSQPCEITVVNYKKCGQPFWNNFSVSPVTDHDGVVTHWIAIGRDVTKRKREDIYKTLITRVGQIFNDTPTLSGASTKMLTELVAEGNLCMAELWLLDANGNHIQCCAKAFEGDKMIQFYRQNEQLRSFDIGDGLPGLIWKEKSLITLDNNKDDQRFIRGKDAGDAGIHQVLGIPLLHGGDFIGALLLGLPKRSPLIFEFIDFSGEFAVLIAAEIRRKKLEQELDRLFKSIPDVICMMNQQGKFLRMNPAGFDLLAIRDDQLLSLSIEDTVQTNQREQLSHTLTDLLSGPKSKNVELSHVTDSNSDRWLAWSLSSFPDEGLIFAVAKDVTEKKQLELLLQKTNEMARIGSWEIDPLNNSTYWSPMMFKLLEYDDLAEAPELKVAINLYKEGASRELITTLVNEAITSGKPFDVEVEIVTNKGNNIWVRVICEIRMFEGKCINVHGSFQDINDRKKAQLAVTAALEERNNILESIGDGFFAVNADWQVTYWNTQAANLLACPKETIVGERLWDIFADQIDSESYKKYQEAILSQRVQHFEDWYNSLERWYSISAYPSSTGLSVFFKDITESRQARKELEELNLALLQRSVALENSEKRYSDLFHLSPQPMWVYDLDSLKFLDVNNAAILHYGYSKEDFLSMTLRDIRPEQDIVFLERSIATISTRENYVSQGSYRHRKKDGELIEVEIFGNTITYRGASAEIVFAIDITERKRYTDAIEAQNKRLFDIAWFQSHVTRVPVARILGLSELLEDQPLDLDTKQIISYLASSAKELDDAIIATTEKIEDLKIVKRYQ